MFAKWLFVVDDGTGNPTAYVLTQFTPAIEWKPLVNVVGGTVDVAPTNGSTNPVQSNGVFDALALKSDTTHNHTGV